MNFTTKQFSDGLLIDAWLNEFTKHWNQVDIVGYTASEVTPGDITILVTVKCAFPKN